MQSATLTPNALALIGLCNEYCAAIEQARQTTRDDFVAAMLRYLPRIYIAATDLQVDDSLIDPTVFIDDALDEDYYDSMRRAMEELLGEDDSYLEVFEEDMKYSDTPIAASIAEGLADIFQVVYNFLETVRNAPDTVTLSSLAMLKEDFSEYWSRKLCNVLRALNSVRYGI